jgi:hypothetical protein
VATTNTASVIETDKPMHESFENSVGPLTEHWNVDFSTFGEVKFTGNQYNTSGMKEPGNTSSAGHGYGTYTVNAMLTGTNAGPAIMLWPGDNKYPGQEINLAELTPDGTGHQYGTVHWVNNGENANEIRIFDGVQSGVFHEYQVVWEPGKITFNVDGQLAATVTDHVPVDYDHGGMNNTIAFLNNRDYTSLIVRDVDYVPLGMTGTVPVVPEPEVTPAPPGSGTSVPSGGLSLVAVSRGGVASEEATTAYNGPVAHLKYQFLGGAVGEVVRGTADNDFINLLGGDDAADGAVGDDVIDGGSGSNFITGGAGRDVFFLDGRSGGVTWGTITDWQPGEELSLWGWHPGVSKTQWIDSAGAAGFEGATMHTDLDGNGTIDASVTWSHRSRGDLPTPTEHDGLLWFHP